jgi:hypothetical protein
MTKTFDNKILNATIIKILRQSMEKMLNVLPTSEPVVSEHDIIESNGYMRLFAMGKFNSPCYLSALNFYLSDKEQQDERPVGTMALYIKEDVMEKFLQAIDRLDVKPDEGLLSDICAEICNTVAEDIRTELAGMGYPSLLISSPIKSKNNAPAGAKFNYDLYKMQEIVFTYWAKECIVIEACLGALPVQKK